MITRILNALFGTKLVKHYTARSFDCTWTRAELRANARAYR